MLFIAHALAGRNTQQSLNCRLETFKKCFFYREASTRDYLIVYTVFNTGAHCAAIAAVFVLDPDSKDEDAIVDKVVM